MKDKFCSPFQLSDGTFIYGGAARNKRIANGGGLENIIKKVISSTYDELNDGSGNNKEDSNIITFPKSA